MWTAVVKMPSGLINASWQPWLAVPDSRLAVVSPNGPDGDRPSRRGGDLVCVEQRAPTQWGQRRLQLSKSRADRPRDPDCLRPANSFPTSRCRG